MKVTFLGGAGTVTGSKYLVETEHQNVLVDCGLFQGWKALRLKNWEAPAFSVQDLDAVILTHAHLDHSGAIPRLYSLGYRGPIYSSHATAKLCKILLQDSAYLQEEEARYANRKGYSKHKPALPLYTAEHAEKSLSLFKTLRFHERVDLKGGLSLELFWAGHILGASMIRLSSSDRSILFSGDLGRPHDLVMRAPESMPVCGALVVESTYGDRTHTKKDALEEVEKIVRDTFERKGVVIIPAFAVGRAQAMLYVLWKLKSLGRLPEVPIYLNSPMATDATDLLCPHEDELALSHQDCENICKIAKYVRTPEESKALNQRKDPMIIIAASGMATGGRVLHHLKAFVGDDRNTILFTGFQAGGTRGAALVSGAKEIKIHGEYHVVRARIFNLEMLSAHADAGEILNWCRTGNTAPKQVFITHGEPQASESLRKQITEKLGWNTSVPLLGDQAEIL